MNGLGDKFIAYGNTLKIKNGGKGEVVGHIEWDTDCIEILLGYITVIYCWVRNISSVTFTWF